MIVFTHVLKIPVRVMASDDPEDKSVGYSGGTIIEDVCLNDWSIHGPMAGGELEKYVDSIEDELQEAAREHFSDREERAKEEYEEYCADMRRDEDRLIKECEQCSLNTQIHSTMTE